MRDYLRLSYNARITIHFSSPYYRFQLENWIARSIIVRWLSRLQYLLRPRRLGSPNPPCAFNRHTSINYSALNSSVSKSTASPLSSPRSSPAPTGLNKIAKIGSGVALPVIGIAALFLATILWQRRRKKRRITSSGGVSLQQDNQPYLQQKAELEAEEKRKHELEATERRCEMDGKDATHEVAEEPHDREIPSLRIRHELSGAEHSHELEASK